MGNRVLTLHCFVRFTRRRGVRKEPPMKVEEPVRGGHKREVRVIGVCDRHMSVVGIRSQQQRGDYCVGVGGTSRHDRASSACPSSSTGQCLHLHTQETPSLTSTPSLVVTSVPDIPVAI